MSLPSPGVLLRAAELALTNEQPIYLDYFSDSVSKTCCIGVRDDNSKNLVKTDSEYGRNIKKHTEIYVNIQKLMEQKLILLNPLLHGFIIGYHKFLKNNLNVFVFLLYIILNF